MKVKVLVTSLSALLISSVYADNSSWTNLNSGNTQATAAQQAQLNQLQAQINTLKSQINNQGNLSSNNGNLGMLADQINRGVFNDYEHPFGNLPDTGLSYALLQEQNVYNKAVLTVGGQVEADIQAWGGNNLNVVPGTYNGNESAYDNGSALSLTTAKLYLLANPNNWTQIFMTVKGGINGDPTASISEAFLTVGNLSKSPLFATLGKTYVPFGIFTGNGPWSNNLTTNAFRSNELSQVIFGFGKGGLNTNIALFNGQNNANDFSYNLQYGTTINNTNLSAGAGYLNDIRFEGGGAGAAYAMNGASTPGVSPLNGGRNGAVDLNASVTYNFLQNQSVGLAGEWVTTTNSPEYQGVSTGKMKSWDVIGTYNTLLANMTTQFGLDYSATQNMQNVPLPLSASVANASTATVVGIKNQWLGYASVEVLNNVFVSPEYARQKLYSGASSWAGTLDLNVYF